ncbi:MAG: CoA transferase [Proteobacteria bacterium]|nr:CoA transferase [Pseudomonadota bacterium]
MGSSALEGVRVLDFTALVQGPMDTQILGDLGADVIKFEREEGEWSRHWGIGNGRTHGEVDSFLAFNRNKKSVAVDLKAPEVRSAIFKLLESADVVIENFRPGVMDRLGYGYEDLRKVNPKIVYACSSGWGQTGPYHDRPGQDMLAQAMSGLIQLSGQQGNPPIGMGVGLVDLYSGMHLVVGILAALLYRARSGEGQRIEVDLFSCATALQQQELTYYLSHEYLPERPDRNTTSRFVTAPFGIYPVADGHIVIAMTPCPLLARAIDIPEIAAFDTNELMLEHRTYIYDAVAKRVSTLTKDYVISALLEHDVWCAPVQDYEALLADPQFAHNGLVWNVPIGENGPEYRTVASPISMSVTPPAVRYGAPRLGEHTREVLGAELGA